jgi:hypothetical protein
MTGHAVVIVAARVLRNTMAQTALSGPGDRAAALGDTMGQGLPDALTTWFGPPTAGMP